MTKRKSVIAVWHDWAAAGIVHAARTPIKMVSLTDISVAKSRTCVRTRASAKDTASAAARVKVSLTILRDAEATLKRTEMSIRRDDRAIAPGAEAARPALALILNLLLISP